MARFKDKYTVTEALPVSIEGLPGVPRSFVDTPEKEEQLRKFMLGVDLAGDDGEATGVAMAEIPVGRGEDIYPAGTILAELRYAFDGIKWAAIVTQADDGPGFQLWFQRGSRFQRSGVFENGKALRKFIREEAAKKFDGFTPVVDTLDRLKNRTAESVIPSCYQAGLFSDEPKCQKCPYVRTCLNPHLEEKRVVESVPPKPEEPEDLFIKKLKGKIKDTWGKK